MVMQTEEQHGQGVALRWSNTDKKSAPRASIMAAASFSTLKKSMADGSTPPQDHHQHRQVLVHSLEQPVKSQREEDHDDPGDQVADDAETEESLMRDDVVGRRGRVPAHEQSVGNVHEAEGGDDGEEQVDESGDSPGVAGRAHVPSLCGSSRGYGGGRQKVPP